MMAKPIARIRALEIMLAVGAGAVLLRAGYLQLVEGADYARRAAAQATQRRKLEAPRGLIYDRSETLLANSLERFRIEIAGEQVQKPESLVAVYRRDVDDEVGPLRAAIRARRQFYAHGPFTGAQVRRLRTMAGVHLTPLYRRDYPSGRLARPLIGSLSADLPNGVSGLERFLDSLLAGTPGETVVLKDASGGTYESPGRVTRLPTRGHDVILTLDRELQEIAESGLNAVFKEHSPRRGDIIMLEPRTGEVLAAASREVDAAGQELASASFFQSSFEPGSTAKLLTAAALLELDRVSPTDAVSGEQGTWDVEGRPRPVRDDHPQTGPISLARAIQVSSNIAMGKFAQRLEPEEHFDMLRAFGLGSPTGVEFPREAAGILPRPERWKPALEGISAAMGYAIQVTPVQLAAAYAAIANDGVLMAPALIKEIRRPDGTTVYRHRPAPVRRVVSKEVAAKLRGYLALSAADSGTGSRAQVKGTVLGKTGTARLVKNRRYTDEHAASFAGIYPARDPQLVVVVRIEEPEGSYYGGFVAAPLVGRMLRQALAARQTALDRVRLADDRVERRIVAEPLATATSRPKTRTWTAMPLATPPARAAKPTEIPDVIGQSVRAAAWSLHRRGFAVKLEGSGTVIRTVPGPGDSLGSGKQVTVIAGRAGSR